MQAIITTDEAKTVKHLLECLAAGKLLDPGLVGTSSIATLGRTLLESMRVRLMLAEETPRDAQIRQLAHDEWHKDGEVEIDDEAIVSADDDPETNGAYVSAWVWVSFEGSDLDEEKP